MKLIFRLFIIIFATQFKGYELRTKFYLVEIKEEWVEEVKNESPMFGLQYIKQVVSNVYLFEEKTSHTSKLMKRSISNTIKLFEKNFGNKIKRIELRKQVQVKFSPPTSQLPFTTKEKFKQLIIDPGKTLQLSNCYPYYGMGIQQAWSMGYTGLGINVAVVDNGVEMNHPDLVNNINPQLSKSFVKHGRSDTNPQSFPSYWETEDVTSHGTLVAGLIAGEFGNYACSSGVAYNATLCVLKTFEATEEPWLWILKGYSYVTEYIAEALAFKNDVIDVYSCSFNLYHKFIPHSIDIKTALEEGITSGRQGKGNVYVFSSGSNEGTIHDCNMDAFASNSYTITISSVGINGSKPAYAIPCASALASTYGQYINYLGDKLLESSRQRSKCGYFSGTSASAAIASGIISQTLQANSELTWRDIQYIIVLTSSLTRLNGEKKPNINGIGLQYDPFFGYGLMNATAMVVMAKTWKTVPALYNSTSSTFIQIKKSFQTRKIYVHTAELPCLLGDVCVRYIENVNIELDYETSLEDNLDIILCSPLGTCSFVLNRIVNATANWNSVRRRWTFSSVHFWGEDPGGSWKVVFAQYNTPEGDVERDSVFSCNSIILRVSGTTDNPFPKDRPLLRDNNSKSQFTAVDYEIRDFLINIEGTYFHTIVPSVLVNESKVINYLIVAGIVIFAIAMLVIIGCIVYNCYKLFNP